MGRFLDIELDEMKNHRHSNLMQRSEDFTKAREAMMKLTTGGSEEQKRVFRLVQDSGRIEFHNFTPQQIIDQVLAPKLAQWESEGIPFSWDTFNKVFEAASMAHIGVLPTITTDLDNKPLTKSPEERVQTSQDKLSQLRSLFEPWFKDTYPDR